MYSVGYSYYFDSHQSILRKKGENVLNNEEKAALIITKISDVLNNLDTEIEILEIKESEKNLAEKKWFTDKKALHEIKYLANRAGTYNNYDENELDDVEIYLSEK